MKSQMLFFETYSVVQTLCFLRIIRRTDVIYFLARENGFLEFLPIRKKAVLWIIKLFNAGMEIKTVPQAIIADFLWDINKNILEYEGRFEESIKNSCLFDMALEMLGDGNVLKFYKMKLINLITDKLLFKKVAEHFKNKNENMTFIPDGNSFFGEVLSSTWMNNMGQQRYFKNRNVTFIRALIKKPFYVLIIMATPFIFIAGRMSKIKFKVDKKQYKVRMPVIWGFRNNGNLGGVKRTNSNDGYLYNANIKRGEIIHVFGDFQIDENLCREYKNVMNAKGITWIDEKEFLLDKKFLTQILYSTKVVIKSMAKNILFLKEPIELITATIYLVHYYLKKSLELENIKYDLEFTRFDYRPSHIISTILCNKQNVKAVGIQHNHSPYSAPYLYFIHLNKYIVYGDIFVRRFSPFWERNGLQKCGRENIDWIVNLMNNKLGLHTLKEKVNNLYGKRKFTALITFPSGRELNKICQWDQIYFSLSELKQLNIDVNLFLRFRNASHLDIYPHLNRFKELPKHDDRIIIDLRNFTTCELMSISDLYIASSASFGISEAIATNARVFTFDYIGFTRLFFPDYGKDFILYTKNNVLNVFKGLESNFKDFDCRWDKMKKDFNYHYDGKNLKRIQNVVNETIQEVNEKNNSATLKANTN